MPEQPKTMFRPICALFRHEWLALPYHHRRCLRCKLHQAQDAKGHWHTFGL